MSPLKGGCVQIIKSKDISRVISEALVAKIPIEVFKLPWEPYHEPILDLRKTTIRGKLYQAVLLPNKVILEVQNIISHIKIQDIYGRWYPMFTPYEDKYIVNWFCNYNQVNCIYISDFSEIMPGNFINKIDEDSHLVNDDIVHRVFKDLFGNTYVNLVNQSKENIQLDLNKHLIYTVVMP